MEKLMVSLVDSSIDEFVLLLPTLVVTSTCPTFIGRLFSAWAGNLVDGKVRSILINEPFLIKFFGGIDDLVTRV
jgi:hypothetical protein